MRRGGLGVVFLTLVVAVGCKGTSAGSDGATKGNPKPAMVVMAVNLGEDDEEGGCGDIIHVVRAAAAKGVHTREVDTRNKADMEAASKKYRIMVQPTVVMVDDTDKEIRRYEGESKGTIAALKADLDEMAKQ